MNTSCVEPSLVYGRQKNYCPKPSAGTSREARASASLTYRGIKRINYEGTTNNTKEYGNPRHLPLNIHHTCAYSSAPNKPPEQLTVVVATEGRVGRHARKHDVGSPFFSSDDTTASNM